MPKWVWETAVRQAQVVALRLDSDTMCDLELESTRKGLLALLRSLK